MEALIALLLIYVLIYCGFILLLSIGFGKVKDFKLKNLPAETTFSIIIPFRNEDQNLRRLLNSLAELNYPTEKFELIFVDDFSDDFSVNVINKWRMQNGKIQTTLLENLRLSSSPKKDAISRAMPIIENQWVVTTDADCIVSSNWLTVLNDYILSSDAAMIAGPVTYDGKTSFRHHFERLDMMSLQGTTIGSFGNGNAFMCNGANFAYTKKLFLDLGGFSSDNSIASGDDVFLLQKAMAHSPKLVDYLKSDAAIVRTNPTESWSHLLQQRVRWASKSTAYQSSFGSDLALVVFFGNLSVIGAVVLAGLHKIGWETAAMIFILKSIPDFILLFQANRFIRTGKFLFPLAAAVIYPFFCVLVALFAIVGRYSWKGRGYFK